MLEDPIHHRNRLADRFVAGLPAAAAPRFADDRDLGATLDALVRAARAAWPAISLPEDAFVAYLAERVASDEAVGQVLAERRFVDLYLAMACRAQDPAALLAFERSHFPAVEAALARRGARGQLAEVQQVLRVQLFVGAPDRPPEIADYAGRGPLRAWVTIMAVRLALKLEQRLRRATSDDDEALAALALDGDPELDHMKGLYRREFKEAFLETLAGLSPVQRNLLRLHLSDGLGIDELGRLTGVHRATAARRMARLREILLVRTRRALTRRLKIGPSELESVLRLIQSRLEVTFEQALTAGGAARAPALRTDR